MKLQTRLAALLLFCSLYSPASMAWGGHHHGWRGGNFGFYFGAPFYPGYGYGYGYNYPYYPPTVITVPVTPPTYIQQAPPVVQQNQAAYWHYCSNPQGYYPYVQECPGGWQLVEPTPQ